jgi:hypothetical protein
MSKQGWEGLSELLGDLYRELTPVVRFCLFGGMALGFGLAFYLIYRMSDDGSHEYWGYIIARAELRLLFGKLCVLTFTGAFIGTTVGVLLEVLFGGQDGSGKKKPPRR